MSEEISLLPEGLRKKEEEIRHPGEKPREEAKPAMGFSVPKEEGEDIEVIEIDEGEIEQVLASEPPLTRLLYRLTSKFEDLKNRMFKPQAEPPPKLPPQFFTPPKPKPAFGAPAKPPVPGAPAAAPATLGGVSVPGSPAVAPALGATLTGAPEKPKVTIKPFDKVPKRVRVIKRVRKPVRVSFVSEEDLRVSRIDVPRRRFTFIAIMILGAALVGGSAYLLGEQAKAANNELDKAKSQLTDVRRQVREKQQAWSSFEDLEPKLKAIIGLLDQHVSANKLLELIERNTLPTVSYQSFSLSPDRRVSLAVVADSYETAASQLTVFQKAEFIQKVEATAYTATYDPPDAMAPSRVEFQAVLTVKDDALLPAATVAAGP